MNVLFVSSEVTPFAKTGGLADVSGVLPKYLQKEGCEVKVVMPRYYGIDRDKLEKLPMAIGINMGVLGEFWIALYRGYLPNSKVEIYFIEYEKYYGRSGLYNEKGVAYIDNAQRFVLLSKASFEVAKALDFKPDIIHANDWHAATIPILLQTSYKNDSFFRDTKSVLTIHNLQFQGVFDKGVMDILGIDWKYYNPFELEAMGAVNLLKGGIAFCDALTTVSPTYAKEIQTKEFGFGLEEHIKAHSYKLTGILNGVDYDEWNPAKDKFIAKNYDLKNLEDKKECKRDLLESFGLEVNLDKPLIGYVGRFAEQKGIYLISQVIERVMDLDISFVMLGSGERWAEEFFGGLSRKYPKKFASYIGYNNEMAHKIEAGSDMFLMPSLFEPCGLNQIYSLRYATLPIVRAVGGLDDTIENYDKERDRGDGFKFWDATALALYHTVKWAVETYRYDKKGFKNMQKRAIKKRFSWEKSAKEYIGVYKGTMKRMVRDD